MERQFGIDALSIMLKSRYFEDKTEQLFKSGLIHGTCHLSNGQEASQAGLCLALEKDDWIVPTHRCHGFTIAHGSSPYEMFSELLGSSEGLAKGLGGSMHMPDRKHCNLGSSAVVGSSVPLALGVSFYLKRHGMKNISVGLFGDGASSRGSIHEAMNLAKVFELPVLFYCENNHYGMSASSSRMVSVRNISERGRAYNIESSTVDGNDVLAVFEAVRKARKHILETGKPYLLEVMTYRTKGHSKSDRCIYRSREEENLWLERDPIALFEKSLLSSRTLLESEISDIEDSCRSFIESQAELAVANMDRKLSKADSLSLVNAPSDSRDMVCPSGLAGKTVSMRQGIQSALSDEMTLDEDVVLLGEDVGIYGGCFKVTEGLAEKHPAQVLDTPVCEEAFAGMAVGSAMMGMRPVIEVMYADFYTLIADPIANHAAMIHFMSAGQFSCPIVVRLPEGSGTGHGPQHTQSPEAFFLNIPGLKILAPSNPSDAYWLLRLAVRDNNPVLFFEHKMLYSCEGVIEPCNVSIGGSRVLKDGKDITIIAWSRAVRTALETASLLAGKGIDATVLDLYSLKPMDSTSIIDMVSRTGRIAIIQDANAFGSIASEVSRIICTSPTAFGSLKAPVLTICGSDSPVPFEKDLEAGCIPQATECAKAILNQFNPF